MKIAVYTICKNEEKHVKRWYESCKDADYIFVLDTGSTDNTINLLKEYNINYKQEIITPWRFDKARNIALSYIPKDIDICVSLDMDEVLATGWKENILKVWKNDTTRLRYVYNWLIEKGVPKVTFYSDKIHKRCDATWINPVHEIVTFPYPEHQVYSNDVIINHYPDSKKSRASYLPLLELSVKENPENDRNMHYLGREYMFHGKYNEAIDTLIKHLKFKNALWKDERCASMRYIARCYKYLNRFEESKMWLEKAILEAPYLRDPYVERALLAELEENYTDILKYTDMALKINNNPMTYTNEIFSYDETINDLRSIAYYYLKDFNKAILEAKKALDINPNNERIKNNLKIYKSNTQS